MEQPVTALLRWSWWRRWHQAWARYHHYRRRAQLGSETSLARPSTLPTAKACEPEVPEDVTDVVWRRLEPLLPPAKRTGRPYGHPRRLVLEAIVYQMRSGCGWHHLPERFPPWQTVYAQLTQWRTTGTWTAIWAGLEQPDAHLHQELQL